MKDDISQFCLTITVNILYLTVETSLFLSE
jgi:hypothetical protein